VPDAQRFFGDDETSISIKPAQGPRHTADGS
jgi:hypothetical protein